MIYIKVHGKNDDRISSQIYGLFIFFYVKHKKIVVLDKIIVVDL